MFFMFATDIVVHLKYTCLPVMEHHWVTKVNKYCLVANDQLRGNFKASPCKCPSTVAAPPKGIQVVSIFNPNTNLHQSEVTWIPVVRRFNSGY